MWQGNISLHGNLFIQAFKSFADGDLDSAAKLVPLLTLKFKELDVVLRHDNKQQLLDFLQFLKKKIEEIQQQQQPHRLKDIDLVLYNIRQSLQPKKESYEQLLTKGRASLKEHKEGQALAFFNLALAEKETQEVLLCIANLQLNYFQQIKEFQTTIEKAMRCQLNELVLTVYEALISQMQYQIEVDLNLRFKVIRRAISLRSKNPNVYLQLAIVGLKLHMKLGEYHTVVEENCPDSIEKPFAIGVISFSEKYWRKAEKNFQACEEKIKINNKNILQAERKLRENGDGSLFKNVSNFKKEDELYYFLGKVNERLKAGRQVQMYEKGLKHNPRNIQIWKQMIRLIQKQPGRQAELLCIIQHLNTFTQYVFSIRDSTINENLIELLFQSGEKEALIEYALGLIASFPDLDLAYYLVAKVYYNVGQYQKCKEYCQKCLKLNGKNQGVFFFLGKIAFDQQKNDDAREYYNKATQLNPKQYLAHFNLGILEYKLCKYQEAAKALKLATECNPDFSPAYELLIHSYMKQGKFQEARDIVVGLPQGENRSQSYLMDFFYAKISYQQEKDKEAEKHFKLVLQKQLDHWDSIYKLVVINISQLNRKDSSVLSQSRTAQAEAYIVRLLNAPVLKGRYKAAKGYLLMHQNKHEEAIPMLMQAINQHKQQFQAYYHLGYALKDRITDIDNLSQELEDLISCNQANIQSYYFSSLFYLGFKAFDHFLEKFNKYIRCPKASQSQSRREIMRIYRSVITHLQNLRRFYPDDNDLILLLGILYRDVANRQKTLHYFRKLQAKLLVQEQTDLLFNKFLRFYNQNGKYQQNSNYLQYIFQYIFLQVYQIDQMQGMKLYNYLIEGHDYFNSNEGIRFAIQERKRDIVSMNLMHVVDRQIEELDGQWRKDILKDNHFIEGRKIIEAVAKEEQERYRRCLIYQFYCNKIYPYVYNDQKAIKSLQLCLQFLLNPEKPKEAPEQLYELTRSKLNPILFTKAQSSYQPYFSQNYKRYESNIYFAEFQKEQLSPFTFDCKHFQLSFKKYRINPTPKSTIQPPKFQFKYLNSLQKKIMKKPLQTQSLIMIAKSSIIARPKALTSIYIEQQSQPFD